MRQGPKGPVVSPSFSTTTPRFGSQEATHVLWHRSCLIFTAPETIHKSAFSTVLARTSLKLGQATSMASGCENCPISVALILQVDSMEKAVYDY